MGSAEGEGGRGEGGGRGLNGKLNGKALNGVNCTRSFYSLITHRLNPLSLVQNSAPIFTNFLFPAEKGMR